MEETRASAPPAPPPWRWPEIAWVTGVFVLLTLLMAAPLSLAPGTRALALSADTRLFLWTISWDVHALTHHPASLFDANIFYPEPRTLAYSEHLLGSAVLGAPALLATGNPVLALNVIVLLSCVLSGLGAFVLARQLRASVPAALAAGLVFAFAAPRFVRLAQVHLATVQWIPFALAFFHRYAQHGRRRDLLAAVALFSVQALTSGHGGLYLTLALGALVLYSWAFGRLPAPGRLARDLGLAGALLLLVNVAQLVPYLRAQRDVGLHRTLGAVYDWAPNAASFLASPTHVQRAFLGLLPGLREAVDHASAYLFPGWVTLLLAGIALARRPPGEGAPSPPPATTATSGPRPRGFVVVLDGLLLVVGAAVLFIHVSGGIEWTVGGLTLTARTATRGFLAFALLAVARLALARKQPLTFAPFLVRCRDGFRRWAESRMGIDVAFYVLLLVLSVWTCLGPGYGLYTALYRLLPGFDLIRVPSRLGVLGLLALSVLAARGLDVALARARESRRLLLAVAALGLMVAEFAAFPLDARPYGLDLPAIDAVLAQKPPPFSVVELPVADPTTNATQSARLNSHYMLHSMAHWQPMVNGYSGIIPPRHERLFRILTAFPETASLRELETLGVRYAVLHREFYTDAEWAGVLTRAEALGDRLHLEAETSDGRLYSLPLAGPLR
jgi:hypothetical protein